MAFRGACNCIALNALETGSHTAIEGSGTTLSGSHTVSPMLTSCSPVTAQMSPAPTTSTATRLKLENTNVSASFPIRGFSISAPSNVLIRTPRHPVSSSRLSNLRADRTGESGAFTAESTTKG